MGFPKTSAPLMAAEKTKIKRKTMTHKILGPEGPEPKYLLA
jgi:hypothetical protein